MAQKHPWPGNYHVQNVNNTGQPPAPYPQYPPQNNVSGYPVQSNHPPPSNQLYHQACPQVYQQPGYGQSYPPMVQSAYYGQPNYGPPPPYSTVTPNSAFPQQGAQGTFDSGARFGAGATANIPPPPPGVMATSAQMASARGQPVAMQQPKAGWLEGGRGGGYTFW